MFGKILDFISTRLRSAETVLDSLSLAQYQAMQSRDSCVQREISSSITLLHTGTIKVQMRS